MAHILGAENPADLMTKVLSGSKRQYLVQKLLHDIYDNNMNPQHQREYLSMRSIFLYFHGSICNNCRDSVCEAGRCVHHQTITSIPQKNRILVQFIIFILDWMNMGVRHHPGHGQFPSTFLPSIFLGRILIYKIGFLCTYCHLFHFTRTSPKASRKPSTKKDIFYSRYLQYYTISTHNKIPRNFFSRRRFIKKTITPHIRLLTCSP